MEMNYMEKIKYILPLCLILIICATCVFNLKTAHAAEGKANSIDRAVIGFTEREANWLKVEVALNEVAKKNPDKYTEESWALVMDAVAKIESAKEEGVNSFSQQYVDELALELTTALNNLEFKE